LVGDETEEVAGQVDPASEGFDRSGPREAQLLRLERWLGLAAGPPKQQPREFEARSDGVAARLRNRDGDDRASPELRAVERGRVNGIGCSVRNSIGPPRRAR